MGVSVENEHVRSSDRRLCGKTAAHVEVLVAGTSNLGLCRRLQSATESTGQSSVVNPGPDARPMEARVGHGDSRPVSQGGVPFFFKQWGGVQKKKTGRTLEGRTWDEMPVDPALVLL